MKYPVVSIFTSFEELGLQLHRNRGFKGGYQIFSLDEIQTQVISAVSTIISYLQRSNVLLCPTLVLLSQTHFLLLLSGSYGYDINCWYETEMIINFRNELPSSFLGCLHEKVKLVKQYRTKNLT